MSNQYLWVEKYRPSTIDECILPDSMKKTFKEFIVSGELPNFLFCGGAGVGKTTVDKALCNEIGAEYLFINGSEESGITPINRSLDQVVSKNIGSNNRRDPILTFKSPELRTNITKHTSDRLLGSLER